MSNVRLMPLTDDMIRRAFEQARADHALMASRVTFLHQKLDGVLAASNTQTNQIGQLQDDLIEIESRLDAVSSNVRKLAFEVQELRTQQNWTIAGWLFVAVYVFLDLITKLMGVSQ